MKFISFCKYNLLFALLLGNMVHGMDPYHHGYHRSDSPTALETVAAVGLVAAAAYGFYKLCDWLFTKTNEQILKEAKYCLVKAHTSADKYIAAIKAGLGEFPESKSERQKVLKNVNEEFLYEYALQMNSLAPSVHFDYWSISEAPAYVAQAGQMASKCAQELRNKNSHLPIVKDLENISNKLGILHTEIVFVNEFFKEHGAYFSLFSLESRLLTTYEFEIASLINYANNPPYLREAMRMAVMKKAAHNRISYPYMNYIEQLEKDLSSLKNCINNLRNTYHHRQMAAQLIWQQLDSIYNMAVSEEAYRQELRDHKKEMLERERIAAEQAKAAAAAAQAQATAAQAHAAHMHAQAMQQHTYALQQQNQLQQQQNNILASQGTPRVNVYL